MVTPNHPSPAESRAITTGLVLTAQPPEETFDAFFRRTYRNLIGGLLATGTPFTVAEEAVRDAMFAAYRRWQTLDNPSAWIRTVARRRAQRLETDLRRHRQLTDADDETAATPAPTEDREWIIGMIDNLPKEQRAVMALYFDDLPLSEIAAELGKTEATVRSTLRHARHKLRDAMQESPGTETPALDQHREEK